MKNNLYILFILTIFLGCSKTDESLPDPVLPTVSSGVTDDTNFIFTGEMYVNKYDAAGTSLSNYQLTNIVSKLIGTNPDYSLVAIINGASLKGETTNIIEVNIPNKFFNNLSVAGTGIFISGVYDGKYANDSLYYTVAYTDIENNNLLLSYRGKLSSSY
ncbi:hypothetical protein FRY74_05265 [Vicingus serpentipes]|jgi:hypothetical protein|uniref:Uncharacterized protein n=1 Tax=Vicingus serpentipes TaxID=1926625 RepID=A0A5C6RUI8_9FLAO|nr:hypothetical protein [Vicingus serpentipes]TXB65981.1 hypothetical protein FRY74_05265 [Vicingus serpentipes]